MKKIKVLFTAVFMLFLLSGAAFALEKSIVTVSGDEQTGIRGYPLKNDYVV